MGPDRKVQAGPEVRKPAILIIDDDPNNLAVLRDSLREFNYTVLAAEDGESGIARADYARPDLILLDIMMPGIDGYETCRRLKLLESTKDIPVIFMTALAETGHKVRGLEAGGVDYITKPFQQGELLARVGVHLSIRELTNKLREANESLENRVAERTADLAKTNRELTAEIAERRQVEERLRASKRKFRAIFDQTFQFIGLMTLDGSLIDINRAALNFIGGAEADVIGRPFWETPWWTHSAEEQEKLRQAVMKAAAGEFVRFETTHPAADGSLHCFDFSLKQVRDEAGNLILLIPEGRDITERKEMERLKDEMISAVSHEMRTPLTAMLGYTEFMLENELEPQLQKEYLTILYKETERLDELIGSFLDLQRFKSRQGPIACRPLAIAPLLAETAALFAASQLHHLTVDCPADLPPVWGNDNHLRQVFNNLVSNAVKYSPEGGEVRLGARLEDDNNIITVRDEGIGIPPRAREIIFDRFYRVDNSDRRTIGGTGLGLALVREIVTAHGGRVWVESEEGKGSTFIVSLPTAKERHEAKALD
ncbi:MAG TPA: ATP-binding protein [Geobacteraceae bacterium]|nr:ATP-binding protein [Geobacteraceae bacterium]